MPRAKFNCLQIWLGAALVTTLVTVSAADPINEDAFNRCRAIADEMARLHCFESLTSPAPLSVPSLPQMAPFGSQTVPRSSSIAGKWRLVRTPTPGDKQDIISIMAPAELSGSDIDFAGINLRCSNRDFEVLIVLIQPLPPRAKPDVTIGTEKFRGSVVSPGTSILLPETATALAKEQWRSLQNLSIVVDDEGGAIRGVVSLEGFNTALQSLVTTCSTQ